MNLKNSNLNVQNENQSKNKIQKVNEEKIEIQPQTQESLDEQELKKALDEIDNISFDDIISKDKDKDEDLEEVYIEERPIDKNEKSLKEFWE